MPNYVIGIAGRRGAGKTTLAEAIMAKVADDGDMRVRIIGFADALRDELAFLVSAGTGGTHYPDRAEINAEKASLYGPGLQWWGEYRRQKSDVDYWVNRWRATYDQFVEHSSNALVLVPDLRYPNEEAAIRDLGGLIVLVDRPEYAIDDIRSLDHPSEKGYATLTPDMTWRNKGTLESLDITVHAALDAVGWRPPVAA